VPSYIDSVVADNKQLQRNFSEGFAWLGPQFITLPQAQQLAMLLPLSNAADAEKINTPAERWFRSMKSLTADGYYTSRAGMVDELGYKGGSVLAAYPECIHEH
jgi:gluconate 2-dehydrogenase gamma chain